MKKKILSSILCVVLGATAMVGCGSEEAKTNSEASGEKVKLRMTNWNNEDTMKDLLKYLKEKVPNAEIEYQFIDNSNYNTIVDTQLSAEEGPDIICESPASALKHAKLGYLVNVNDLSKRFSPSGTDVYKYDGNVYALPGISWFEGIYYNEQIFNDNNIELPKTFDEFIAASKKLQELGIKPLAAGLKSWEPMLKNSMAFVTAEYLSTDAGKNFGQEFREGKVKLDGTWNMYLEKWSEMIKSGIYTKDMTGIDHDQALEEFATGKAAMFCSGPWDLEAIKEKNPDLKLNMMPFYGTKPSDGWLIGGPGCGFAVNAKSKNKDEAMKVLEAIATPEGQKALWQNNQGGSSYLKGVTFELPAAFNGAEKAIDAGHIYCPWNEWGDAGAVHVDYGKQMQSYLLGNQDLKTTLQNVDNAAGELINK
ncbi:ABC transporter substrate-binding protein [Clostridium sp. B9]|uniref:ABC transporter substrate-binding protein n=1 Tax=Clostridium sp. B9 TaxID=3423224 RepID=UPI003D2ECDAB